MTLSIFDLTGSYCVAPAQGAPSLQQLIGTPLREVLALSLYQTTEQDLTADGAQNVNFGGITNAHVVVIKTDGKVTATITSADGAVQLVPVDTVFVLVSLSTPITAIDVTRVSGTDTHVTTFLGQQS